MTTKNYPDDHCDDSINCGCYVCEGDREKAEEDECEVTNEVLADEARAEVETEEALLDEQAS